MPRSRMEEMEAEERRRKESMGRDSYRSRGGSRTVLAKAKLKKKLSGLLKQFEASHRPRRRAGVPGEARAESR